MSSSCLKFLLRNYSSSTTYIYIIYVNLLLVFSATYSTKHAFGCYTSIFSFGDSLTDTGNLLQISITDQSVQTLPHFVYPPYGETYFHRPTGRCSDGRLIIDFIAQHLGFSFVPPYFSGQKASTEGVNFAVVGACALDNEYYVRRGIYNPYTNNSLGVQMVWFKQMLPSLCHTPSNCKKLLQSSLILMGEIGGNDYNHALLHMGRSIEEIRSFVPPVINAIGLAITELIELGAVTLVVPGNFPLGCLPSYLSKFMMSSVNEDYDPETGCLIWLNEFAEHHNEMLRTKLNQIQELHPHAKIVYADYYNVAMPLYRSPLDYGFTGGALTACCGAGGPYNHNESMTCGYLPSRPCDDPSSYVNWDGLHLTEAAYRWIFRGLLEGPYTVPPLTASCISLSITS